MWQNAKLMHDIHSTNQKNSTISIFLLVAIYIYNVIYELFVSIHEKNVHKVKRRGYKDRATLENRNCGPA